MRAATNAVIAFQVTRYRCPHCARTGSNRKRMQDHANDCSHDPDTRSCPTCAADVTARLVECIGEPSCLKGAREYGKTFAMHCPSWEPKATSAQVTG